MRLLFTLLILCSCAEGLHAGAVTGRVTDDSGRPVQDARVDHVGTMVIVSLLAGPGTDDIRTDGDGRFRVTTSVPVIVIRKPGYVSQRLAIHGDDNVQVTLRRWKRGPTCRVPPSVHVRFKRANDVDYTGAWYYIKTKHGKAGIFSGSGRSYSWGAPSDSMVWTSVEYHEVMFENGVIDAWGHSADGKYWRSCVMDTVPMRTP